MGEKEKKNHALIDVLGVYVFHGNLGERAEKWGEEKDTCFFKDFMVSRSFKNRYYVKGN